MQGSREFKNEIELLSRVHHKNLMNLVGFCFDQGEQMLVYEFIPNGTLMDSLSGNLIFRQQQDYYCLTTVYVMVAEVVDFKMVL